MEGKLPVTKQGTPLPLNALTGYSLRRYYERCTTESYFLVLIKAPNFLNRRTCNYDRTVVTFYAVCD